MSSVKVLAGDFVTFARHHFMAGGLMLVPKDSMWAWPTRYDAKKDIKELTIANEQTGVRAFGAAGWGVLGAMVAGPLGAVVGGILGGSSKEITFVAVFTDGKKVLARTDAKTWDKILAARF